MKRTTFKTNSKPKSPDFVQNWARQISLKLFLGFFDRIRISPNKITVINFFTNNLAAVYFFSRGNYISNLIGLFFCFSSAALDYIDGTIARKRGIESKLGDWLDATLDFIWQNMLLCSIVYGVFSSRNRELNWLIIGFFTVIGLVIANHMGNEFNKVFGFSYHKHSTDFVKKVRSRPNKGFFDSFYSNILAPTNFAFIFFFTVRYLIVVGAVLNIMHVALIFIMVFSIIKAITLFYIYVLFLQYRDGKKVRHLDLIKALNAYYHTKSNRNLQAR